MDDTSLLQEYAAKGSETAFRALVERHVSLVYFAALRHVHDPFLAEDVTQVVFIILARKAGRLPRETILAGWLYRTARFTAEKAVRTESRRRLREQEALEMQTTGDDSLRLAPVLDDAMAQLAELDRTAILLRFFENKNLKEIGGVLDISEDAAQKRVSRAITKLRELVQKRGVSLPEEGMTASLAALGAVTAPAHLINSAAVVSLGHDTGSATVHALLHATLKRPVWPYAVATALVLLVCVVTIVVWPRHRERRLSGGFQPGPASITVRVPGGAPRPQTRIANIAFNLNGTPGLKYNLVYAHDDQTYQTNGLLPAQVVFQADAFTASIAVQGPGQFGFEVRRNDWPMAQSFPSAFTNASYNVSIQGFAGGQGVSFSAKGDR